MIDRAQLASLLERETSRVEWKESRPSTEELLRAVGALANDLEGTGQDGHLVIGVDDDGRPVGRDASDAEIRQVTDKLRSTRILPHPSCDVEAAELEGRKLMVIRVAPSDVPPIVKVDGVAWVRIGTSTHRATDADLARLNERRPESRIPFDLRSCGVASLDDLDLALLRIEHAAARDDAGDPETFPPLEAWLAQRDLARSTPDGWRPTFAGLLCYGLSPQQQVPGAVIEFVRYSGRELDDPVASRKTAAGRLRDQLEAVWAQLTANLASIPAPVPAEGIRTPYVHEYPLEALRELARNIVQHRLYEATNAPARVSWFDDRIVFSNPGGPFGQAGQGEFGEHSDYRNPTVTRLLVEQGYVEKLGRGIAIVRRQLQANGNPPLEIEVDGFTTVVVRKRP
jgi:ATP-dependent DNA helicase RecG